jgi:hypothetical protein
MAIAKIQVRSDLAIVLIYNVITGGYPEGVMVRRYMPSS